MIVHKFEGSALRPFIITDVCIHNKFRPTINLSHLSSQNDIWVIFHRSIYVTLLTIFNKWIYKIESDIKVFNKKRTTNQTNYGLKAIKMEHFHSFVLQKSLESTKLSRRYLKKSWRKIIVVCGDEFAEIRQIKWKWLDSINRGL